MARQLPEPRTWLRGVPDRMHLGLTCDSGIPGAPPPPNWSVSPTNPTLAVVCSLVYHYMRSAFLKRARLRPIRSLAAASRLKPSPAMKTPFVPSALLLVALLALSFRRADCHGYLSTPMSRNALANSDYCPHCLNAGGPYERWWPGRGTPLRDPKSPACRISPRLQVSMPSKLRVKSGQLVVTAFAGTSGTSQRRALMRPGAGTGLARSPVRSW